MLINVKVFCWHPVCTKRVCTTHLGGKVNSSIANLKYFFKSNKNINNSHSFHFYVDSFYGN